MKLTENTLFLRQAVVADAEAVAEIYNYYICNSTATFDEEPVTIDDMARLIGAVSTDYPFIVAVDDGCVAGYCYAHRWKEKPAYKCTLETTVYLRPGYEGRGVGRMLMRVVIAECRRRPVCHSLIACITSENTASIEFHRQLGFREVSCFKEAGYKFGRYLDVTDMQLEL